MLLRQLPHLRPPRRRRQSNERATTE